MATQVNSVAPLPGGIPYVGAVGIASVSPAIVVGQSSGTNAITLALGNIGGVTQLNSQVGIVDITTSNGFGSVSAGGSAIVLNPFAPASGTATSGVLVAGNLSGGVAWQGSGSPLVSTVAYVPGAVVIYSGTTYVCLVAQPIGSVAPTNGSNWQSIGGGGGGGGSSITNTGATLAIDATGTLAFTNPNTASNINQINLTTTLPTTTPGSNAGDINITSGGAMNLTAVGDIIISQPSTGSLLTLAIGNGDINIAPSGIVNVQMEGGSIFFDGTNSSVGVVASGNATFINTTAWSNTAGYFIGTIVFTGTASAPTGKFLCYVLVAPVNAPASNPTPDVDTAHWISLGGGGGGSGSSITGGTAPNTGTVSCDLMNGEINLTGAGNAEIRVLANASILVDSATQIVMRSTDVVGGNFEIGGILTSVGLGVSATDVTFGGVSLREQMRLSSSAGAVWDAQFPYSIGAVVNNSSPVGVFVCIQAVPPAVSPQTNPNPTSAPTFWTELIASPSPTGTSMVYLNTFNNTLAYVAQSVVLFDDASYVCILATTAPTAPAVNPPPNTATTNWQPLGGKSIFYNAYDETGATPYPPGAVVLSGGVYWYATVAYIPPSPVVALPPINFTTVGWKLLSSTYNEFPILGVPAFLVPPLSNTGLASVQTSTNNTATAPFTDFTNDTGSTGFAGGGVGTPLTPGGRYLVKYNMSFIANIVNVNTSTAQYIVSMTFNQPVVFPAPLSYYQIFDSGVVGAGATPIPSQPISGSFTFLAPPDATYIGIQIENILVSGTGFPADNTNQRCFISFSDINEDPATTTTGLLLTAFG